MLYIFMGPSCTGKSTVANKLQQFIDVEVFAGKDYLSLGKSEQAAWQVFNEKLTNAARSPESSKQNVVYIVTEVEQVDKISTIDGSYKVKFIASLDTIKTRFAQRMHGNLPQPVEKMLEKQYREWKNFEGDMQVDTSENDDSEEIARIIAFG